MGSTISLMAQYRITEDDYASALRFHAWRRFIARPPTMAVVAGGIALVVFAFIFWQEPSLLQPVVFAIMFVVPLLAILYAYALFVRVPKRARQHYRQYKGIWDPVTIELMDAGVNFSNADGSGTLPWSKVFQWRQNDRFIFIYTMPALFHIVPKSIAQEGFDIELLVQRLIAHVGPES
jgi:hypothetical protein